MDYEQARGFLKETAKYGSVYGLESIRQLMQRLGNVQEQLSIIHVAGTNGKGSICAMLAAILQAAGYRTGLYASPAVFEPEEIIKVDGSPISKKSYADLISKVQNACRQMQAEGFAHPTAFEIETAAAFCYFWQRGCAYVVLETGLGGALDATNLILHPVLSVLSSISKDHIALLGSTLEEIAAAKAGIIKPGCACVSAAQKPEVLDVLERAAWEAGSTLYVADGQVLKDFTYDGQKCHFKFAPGLLEADTGEFQEASCALTGVCQKENIACVLAAVRLLRQQGAAIPVQAVQEGLAQVDLPGRMERIAQRPDFYIDGAHNERAAYFLQETVRHCFAKKRMIYIVGVLADKDYEKLLAWMLPYAAQVFTVTPDNPRALDGQELARQAKRFHPSVSYVSTAAQAVALALEAAGADGVVVAFGSFSYLNEIKQAVKQKNGI